MNLLQVLFHFVWTGKLLSTYRTWEDFPLRAFVIEESVSLEAVFVLETLQDLNLLTFDTSIGSIIGNMGIFEQIKAPH